MSKLDDSRPTPAHFDDELLDKHFEYTYDNGWKYEVSTACSPGPKAAQLLMRRAFLACSSTCPTTFASTTPFTAGL